MSFLLEVTFFFFFFFINARLQLQLQSLTRAQYIGRLQRVAYALLHPVQFNDARGLHVATYYTSNL